MIGEIGGLGADEDVEPVGSLIPPPVRPRPRSSRLTSMAVRAFRKPAGVSGTNIREPNGMPGLVGGNRAGRGRAGGDSGSPSPSSRPEGLFPLADFDEVDDDGFSLWRSLRRPSLRRGWRRGRQKG